MREALRRLFWLIPVLGLGSAGLFWLLSACLVKPDAGRAPLFFNPHPTGVAEHAQALVDRIASRGDPTAAAELARLGGAALPVVLPRFDRLSPSERSRVALALGPVARRMGVTHDPGALDDPVRSVVFWTRFWQARELDFRPTVAARLVRRLAQRELSLRRADLLQLDTYSLPELVGSIGAIRDASDVARARRLLDVVSHVTERNFRVPEGATREQARTAATACRRFWDENRASMSEVTGLRRLTGTLTQTRYAHWATRALREITGLDSSELGAELAARSRVTGLLLACGLFGGLSLGALGAAAAGGVLVTRTARRAPNQEMDPEGGVSGSPSEPPPGNERAQSNSGTRLVRHRVLTALATCLAVPGMLLWTGRGSLLLASALCALMGAIPALHLFSRELEARLDWRTKHVLRRRRFRGRVGSLASWLAPALPTWAPLALAEMATVVFALEWAWGLSGVGPPTLDALRAGDLPWLMAVCLSLGTATAVTQVLADALIGTPRWNRGEA